MEGFHGGAGFLISNFVFPNDLHVHWSMMIVLYPFLSGLVDGAFIVAALYYVFGVKSLKPVSRFSLVFALAFLTCATMPVLLHLGRPERNLNMLLTPSPTSAMAGGGYVYALTVIVLALIVFFEFRKSLVDKYRESTGMAASFYRIAVLGFTDTSPKTLAVDRKMVKILSAVGIPVATLFHGYVGFLFGGVKANPTWSSPLMPVIFLFSACVSGISAIILGYLLLRTFRKRSVDMACLKTLIHTLSGFFILAFCFEMLEVFAHNYLRSGYHHMVEGLLNGPLHTSFWVWQVYICSGVSFLLLAVIVWVKPGPSIYKALAALLSILLILQVLFMRWNVVIGGQLMSKSARGYTEFHPEWLDKEGILAVIILFLIPFIMFFILSRILPLWHENNHEHQNEFIQKISKQ